MENQVIFIKFYRCDIIELEILEKVLNLLETKKIWKPEKWGKEYWRGKRKVYKKEEVLEEVKREEEENDYDYIFLLHKKEMEYEITFNLEEESFKCGVWADFTKERKQEVFSMAEELATILVPEYGMVYFGEDRKGYSQEMKDQYDTMRQYEFNVSDYEYYGPVGMGAYTYFHPNFKELWGEEKWNTIPIKRKELASGIYQFDLMEGDWDIPLLEFVKRWIKRTEIIQAEGLLSELKIKNKRRVAVKKSPYWTGKVKPKKEKNYVKRPSHPFLKEVGKNDTIRDFVIDGETFEEKTFEKKTFDGLHAEDTDFQRSDFSMAIFSDCKLMYANFEDCSLDYICIVDTRLEGANFRNTNLCEAIIRISYAKGANFEEAYLGKAELYDTCFDEGKFKKAYLKESICDKSVFRRADFRKANMKKGSFKEADLERANLEGADLREVNGEGANFQKANLRKADLRGGKFKGADFRGADLTGAKLEKADFTDALFEEEK